MLSNKVKSLLMTADLKSDDLATALGINKQSLLNKYNRNSFTVADLIKAAELCGYTLSFTNGSNTITLTVDDVEKKEASQN